jgi:hypothetical protein
MTPRFETVPRSQLGRQRNIRFRVSHGDEQTLLHGLCRFYAGL